MPRKPTPHPSGLVLVDPTPRSGGTPRIRNLKQANAAAAYRATTHPADNGQPTRRRPPKATAPQPPPPWVVVFKEVHGQLVAVKLCPPMLCEGADLERYTVRTRDMRGVRHNGGTSKGAHFEAFRVGLLPPSLPLGQLFHSQQRRKRGLK